MHYCHNNSLPPAPIVAIVPTIVSLTSPEITTRLGWLESPTVIVTLAAAKIGETGVVVIIAAILPTAILPTSAAPQIGETRVVVVVPSGASIIISAFAATSAKPRLVSTSIVIAAATQVGESRVVVIVSAGRAAVVPHAAAAAAELAEARVVVVIPARRASVIPPATATAKVREP